MGIASNSVTCARGALTTAPYVSRYIPGNTWHYEYRYDDTPPRRNFEAHLPDNARKHKQTPNDDASITDRLPSTRSIQMPHFRRACYILILITPPPLYHTPLASSRKSPRQIVPRVVLRSTRYSFSLTIRINTRYVIYR